MKHDPRQFIYRISASDHIIEVNEAWLEFARENGAFDLVRGPVVGRLLWDFIPQKDVRNLYNLILNKVRHSGRSVQFSYRCDSPKIRRYMQFWIRPIDAEGTVEFASWIEQEVSREPVELEQSNDANADQTLKVCSWCKKVEVPSGWMEAEEAIQDLKLFDSQTMPCVSYGVCGQCLQAVQKKLELL